MIQPLQTKPIILSFMGQDQLPVVLQMKAEDCHPFFVTLSTFKGSQALSAYNLFLFLHCFDVISCFPRQELVHLGVEVDKSGCAAF